MRSLAKKWRAWKCHLKAKYFDESKDKNEMVVNAPDTVNPEHFAFLIDYWLSECGKSLSEKNKQNRSFLKDPHTGGTKAFARHAHDMEKQTGVAPNRAQLYTVVHTRKDGTPVNKVAEQNMRKIEELMSQQLPNSSSGSSQGCISWAPDDIYSQVMGKESHGRVRGVGLGPTPSVPGCSVFRNYEMSEERVRDQEQIVELQEKVMTYESQLKEQERQMKNQESQILALEEKFTMLEQRMLAQSLNPSLQGAAVDGGSRDASPHTQQKSSCASRDTPSHFRGTI